MDRNGEGYRVEGREGVGREEGRRGPGREVGGGEETVRGEKMPG